MNDNKLRIELILEKMETVMPEVRRQVALYEKNKKDGTLKPLPLLTSNTHNCI